MPKMFASASHAAAEPVYVLKSFIPLRLKCGSKNSSFEGVSGPFPYPYLSNQKGIETPLPLHVNAQSGEVGERGRAKG